MRRYNYYNPHSMLFCEFTTAMNYIYFKSEIEIKGVKGDYR